MSDFETVRGLLEWLHGDAFSGENAYSDALAALNRIEAEVKRLRAQVDEDAASFGVGPNVVKRLDAAEVEVKRLRKAANAEMKASLAHQAKVERLRAENQALWHALKPGPAIQDEWVTGGDGPVRNVAKEEA